MQDYQHTNEDAKTATRLNDLYLYFETGEITPYVSYDQTLGQVWFKIENVPFTAKAHGPDITLFYAKDDNRVIGGFLGTI